MKLISGGQTGVDRAALDAAMSLGIAVGGWCPAGRRAEDGPIHPRYPLVETPETGYDQRTEWNVRDCDGTLILSADGPTLSGGTQFTFECALRFGKPVIVADPATDTSIEDVCRWLRAHRIEVLNVAGPRDSPDHGIYEAARDFICRLFLTAVNADADCGD